jgi:hypothetical protein
MRFPLFFGQRDVATNIRAGIFEDAVRIAYFDTNEFLEEAFIPNVLL